MLPSLVISNLAPWQSNVPRTAPRVASSVFL
jgi:hypothetical protein